MPPLSTRASFTAKASAAGDRRVKFVASTRDVDRHGTRLLPRGCKYDNFLKNPVILYNHSKDSNDPDDIVGRAVEISVTDDAVLITVEFEGPENKKADRCLQKVRKDFLRAVSVGFIALRESPPDKEGVVDVLEWELAELSLCPVGSNPSALKQRGFTVSAARTLLHSRGYAPLTPSRGLMEPKAIMEKLGLAEGAKPEEIAAALVKYLAGPDSDADKMACVVGLLGMLTPAASSTSDGAAEASMDAAADEIRRLNARVAELEEGAKKPTESAEERADKACKAGQWPMAKRDALLEQYKAGKTPYLFAAKTFSTRGVNYTAGGNPVQTDSKPVIVDASTAKTELSPIENQILANAKRAGLSLTPEQFAAAKAKLRTA